MPCEKYLVSGVTGLVGSAVAESLVDSGTVTGLSRDQVDSAAYSVRTCDIRHDIPDMPDLTEAVVIHCAAEIRSADWAEHYEGNVSATRRLLDWAVKHRAKRFVYISTGSVYGVSVDHPSREVDPLYPMGYYANSKSLAEELCRAYERIFSIPVVILRLYYPYSLRQSNGLFANLLRSLRNEVPVRLNVGGTPLISVCAIEDVVSAVALSSRPHFCPGTYNLCGDLNVKVGDVVKLMEELLACRASVERTGYEAGQLVADNSKLKSQGWMPVGDFEKFIRSLVLTASPAAGE